MLSTIPGAATLRPAAPADAAALAALHVAVWRATYGDLAPPEAVARLDESLRLRQWQAALADPDRATWIAESGGALCGLVSTGTPSEPAFGPRGEVKHLYVAATARRQGLGSRLLAQGRAALAQAGFPGAGLGVVRENTPARRFYAAEGGREVAGYTDPGPLWRSAMVLVAWD